MGLLSFLVIFPAIVAIALFLVKQNEARNVIVVASAILIGLASIVFCLSNLAIEQLEGGAVFFPFASAGIDLLALVISLGCAGVVLYQAQRYKNTAALVLAIVQIVLACGFEISAHVIHATPVYEVLNGLYFDSLTLLMVFVIGVIGSGICVYALGYMADFQEHHADEPDRRPYFFGLMFLFLSAMYVIVFSNNMTWMLAGWEVTTVCSFLLIGYTRTEEAIRNSFRQIIMNMLGGIAFTLALWVCAAVFQTLSFVDFIRACLTYPEYALFSVALLGFAGITKAAQMPFHTWLLGAMVAPTPTSALLHSSTMVKAGVFLLIKLAPAFAVMFVPSLMVILVGGITFCLASFIAISQSNAKLVLAYSTVANLGLIVACAGVGTPEAVWAAMFLLLFHAIAKSLLFLCVGTAEHHIGSRNIEDMDLLFERMPRLARFMMIGIMTMFIAPFGMLVSKWATLVSFVDTHQIALIILLAFGSAATFMFWTKWLGKLAGIAGHRKNIEVTVHKTEWAATWVMVVLLIASCIGLPIISMFVVSPYLLGVYGPTYTPLGNDVLWLIACLSILVFAVMGVGFSHKDPGTKQVDIYLSGISVNNEERIFQSSFSKPLTAGARNMYLTEWFGEKRIVPVGEITCAVIMGLALFASMVSVLFSVMG